MLDFGSDATDSSAFFCSCGSLRRVADTLLSHRRPHSALRTAFAWIALLPLLYALSGRDKEDRPLSIAQSATIGYLCGVLWYAGNCYWIYQTMYLYGGLPKPVSLGILLLFALYLGLYHALFAAILGALRRSILTRNQVLSSLPLPGSPLNLPAPASPAFPGTSLASPRSTIPSSPALPPTPALTACHSALSSSIRYGLCGSFSASAATSAPFSPLAGRRLPRLRLRAARSSLASAEPRHGDGKPGPGNISVGAERTGPPETTQQLLNSFSDLSTHPSPSFLSGIPEMPGTPEVVMLHKAAHPTPRGRRSHAILAAPDRPHRLARSSLWLLHHRPRLPRPDAHPRRHLPRAPHHR